MVSLSRLVLLGPWIWCALIGSVWVLPIMAVIVASDLLDGPLARRLSTAGGRGVLIDATCDALVVVTATATLGFGEARYFGLAGLMAAAFLSWAAYSLVIGHFAYTRLGRYDGAWCYALVAGASARAALGIRLSATGEGIIIGLVAVFLGISTVENIVGMLQAIPGVRQCRGSIWSHPASVQSRL